MLTNLHIENIAVARRLDIDFTSGFTVLTGETGAGKSLIVGALSLLTGGRFDRDLLRAGEDRALVSAVFCDISSDAAQALLDMDIEPDVDGCLYLQRTLSADGRSQCRINGRAVPGSVLRDAGSLLIHIHGQHENQRLLRASSHRELLDRFAEDAQVLQAYQQAYAKRREIQGEMDSLKRDDAERARLTEILEYQIKEIDAAKLRAGEEEALESERARLRNADRISRQCKLINRALFQNDKGISACDMIARAIPAMEQIREFLPDADMYLDKLHAFRSELEEIAQQVTDVAGLSDEDPQKALDRVESRLQVLTKLERKYGATVEEVLEFRRQSAQRLQDLNRSEDRLAELEEAYRKADREAAACAQTLHEYRVRAGLQLQEGVKRELAFLDMEKVAFSVQIEGRELSPDGGDEISFLISANPGEPQKPLDRIASGGELSRIMLALKCVLQGREATDTLIFDEVDTGVSGRISQRIGVKLRQISLGTQVLCVTHAAQIAATANTQMRIYKRQTDGRTESAVQILSEEERVQEIARIMGGSAITEGLLQSARELRRESELLGGSF